MKYSKYYSLFLGLFFFWACQNESSSTKEVSTSSTPPKVVANPESKPKAFTGMPSLPKTQELASGKLLPVDEGQLSPDFERFRAELLRAIYRKDVDFIEQLLAEDIKIGLGDDSGKAAFAKKWTPRDPDTRFWQSLQKILLLGGTFDRQNKNGFMAPYLPATWPDLDASKYAVVTGKEVKARKRPSLEGAVVGVLTYDVVRLGEANKEATFSLVEEEWPWVKIEMPDKLGMAYVYGKYIHSPIDYRAYFERINGQWKMLSFLAGD